MDPREGGIFWTCIIDLGKRGGGGGYQVTAWHKPIKFVYYIIVAVQYKVRHRSESVHPSVVSGCPSKGVGFLQFRNSTL